MTHLTPHRIKFVDGDTIIVGFTNKEERVAYLEFFSGGSIYITYKTRDDKFACISTTYAEAESKLLEILNDNISNSIIWTGKNHRDMFDFLTNTRNQPMTTKGENFFIDHSKGRGGLCLKVANKDYFVEIGTIIRKKLQMDFIICPRRPVEYVNITFKILKTTQKRAIVGFWGIIHDILKGTS